MAPFSQEIVNAEDDIPYTSIYRLYTESRGAMVIWHYFINTSEMSTEW